MSPEDACRAWLETSKTSDDFKVIPNLRLINERVTLASYILNGVLQPSNEFKEGNITMFSWPTDHPREHCSLFYCFGTEELAKLQVPNLIDYLIAQTKSKI
jgi:hypothetical protein